MKSRYVSFLKRGFDFETLMWLFTRLSALAMYLCAFIGLVGALIMGARTQLNMADLIRWTFMPDPNHALLNTANQIVTPDAWMTSFWRVMGSIFVAFAASHGLHGLLEVLEDYNSIVWLRWTLRYLVLTVMIIMIAIGVYVIWTS
jgi:succinate dehydrogenase hydrophobic anchor subunit